MEETRIPALDVLGRRNLELGPFVDGGQSVGPWAHWKLRADEDGIVWLLLDKKGTSTNTPDLAARFASVVSSIRSRQ